MIGTDSENWLTCGGWLDGEISGSEQIGSATAASSAQASSATDKSEESLELPHASDGWQVPLQM